MESAYDIVVLGGGPAGAGCAISLWLSSPQWNFTVFEGPGYDHQRACEIHPAQALPLLCRLRVPLEVLHISKLTGESIATARDQSELEEQHHLFSPAGGAK